jgi:hypothetical protein
MITKLIVMLALLAGRGTRATPHSRVPEPAPAHLTVKPWCQLDSLVGGPFERASGRR